MRMRGCCDEWAPVTSANLTAAAQFHNMKQVCRSEMAVSQKACARSLMASLNGICSALYVVLRHSVAFSRAPNSMTAATRVVISERFDDR